MTTDDIVIERHFVEFYSPGTFMAETSERPIDSWNVEAAKRLADGVAERHGATPYAFRFITRGRGPSDLDSRELRRSHTYYLGGKVETIDEIRRRANPGEAILLSNMEGNGWDRVVVNDNSWRWVQPLREGDVVLEYTAPARAAGKERRTM